MSVQIQLIEYPTGILSKWLTVHTVYRNCSDLFCVLCGALSFSFTFLSFYGNDIVIGIRKQQQNVYLLRGERKWQTKQNPIRAVRLKQISRNAIGLQITLKIAFHVLLVFFATQT